MKFRKIEYLLLIVAIAALAAYLGLRRTDRAQYRLPVIAEAPAGEFTKIEIAGGGRQATLLKQDETWRIQPHGFPADAKRVEGMLAALADLKTTALASEAGDYRRYELDEAHRLSVKAWAGERLVRELELGKTAPSFRHTFVKLAGDPRVFHAEGNFRAKFSADAEDLQDKVVLRLERKAVRRLAIGRPGEKTVAFERGNAEDEKAGDGAAAGKWRRADGAEADPAAVERLIGALAALRCTIYIGGKEAAAFGEPVYTLEVDDGSRHTLTIYAKQGAKPGESAEQHPAAVSGRRHPFYLGAQVAERIMQPPSALMPQAEQGSRQEGQEAPKEGATKPPGEASQPPK